MPKVRLTHASGSVCEIYHFGATVTKYTLGNGEDIIFLSKHAVFDNATPIRGGIPVVFPQFGHNNKNMPKHGFARNREWKLDEKRCCVQRDGLVEIVMTLNESPETLKMWPFEFQLEYNVRLTAYSLQTALTITNPKLVEWSFETLLHTYLYVPSLEKSSVNGLKDAKYLDKTDDGVEREERQSDIHISGEVDRVYKASTGMLGAVACTTVKKSSGDSVRIEATCSRAANNTWTGLTPSPDIVLWNPGSMVAPPDLREEFEHMICVEPGLVSSPVTTLIQGRMTLTQTITCQKQGE